MPQRLPSAPCLLIFLVTFSFAQNSQDPSILLEKGKQELAAEHFAQAVQAFSQAVQLTPESQEAASGLLYALLKQKDLSHAIVFGRQSTAKWPNNASLHHWLGLAYFQAGDGEGGEQELILATTLKASDYDTRFDLALVRLTKKDYAKAAESLESALRLRSSDALAHVLLGRAYLNSNRTLKAIEQFKTAERLNPGFPLLHYHLGYAYESLGRDGEAIEQYRAELARGKSDPEVLGQLGHALVESGQWRRGSDYLKQALKIEPARADWIYALGKAHFMLGELDSSVQLLTGYTESRPDDPSGHYLLAEALERSGNRDEAKSEMQKFRQASHSQQLAGASASRPQ